MTKEKRSIESFIIYGILFIVCIWLLQGKNNFHVDETFSYGLANHAGGVIMLPPEDGKVYSIPEEAYYEYLTADEEWRFHYSIVWNNQYTDVHPPLYYAILHTICSMFPETFSIWYAGIINIVAVGMTLFILRKMADILELENMGKRMLSLIFIFSTGIASTVCFLRMYALAMFWVTLTAYIFMFTIKFGNINWKIFFKMCVVAVCGALTHYYYLVYLFFLCVVYFVYLMFTEKKKIVPFIFTYIGAGIISIGIFPSMIFHMFEDTRGVESIENLNSFTIDSFMERFRTMKSLVDRQLFSGYFGVFLIGLFVLVIIRIIFLRKKADGMQMSGWLWGILIVPCVCYFVLVTQIAVYVDARYIIPIYAVLISGIYGLFFRLISVNKLYGLNKVIICLIGCCVIGIMVTQNECDYRKVSKQNEEHFRRYADSECICVHNGDWQMQTTFTKIRNYGSVRFISEEKFYDFSENVAEKKELLVTIAGECEQERIIEKVLDLYPELKYYEIVGKGYSTTYCFSSETIE